MPTGGLSALTRSIAVVRALHALKVAAAAALAWLLVLPLWGVADEYPYYAPMGAVVSVAGTVAGSVRLTVSTVVAIALGAAPAIAALLLLGPGVVALALVVLVGAWVASWERLGSGASWVPISGLFILVIGASDPWRFATAYLGLIAYGAAIGLGVHLLWPALPLNRTQAALDALRDTLADQLQHLADGLAADPLPTGDDWEERRSDITTPANGMDTMLAQTREAQRVNWRAPRWRRTAEHQYDQARALKSLSFFVEDVFDVVARHERADLEQVALGPELRPVAAEALSATASALSAGTGGDAAERWHAAREATDALAAKIIERRGKEHGEYFAAGALVTILRRALDALTPADQS